MITLQVGSRFDLEYVDDSEEEILYLLHEMHYAQAKVEIEELVKRRQRIEEEREKFGRWQRHRIALASIQTSMCVCSCIHSVGTIL